MGQLQELKEDLVGRKLELERENSELADMVELKNSFELDESYDPSTHEGASPAPPHSLSKYILRSP